MQEITYEQYWKIFQLLKTYPCQLHWSRIGDIKFLEKIIWLNMEESESQRCVKIVEKNGKPGMVGELTYYALPELIDKISG